MDDGEEDESDTGTDTPASTLTDDQVNRLSEWLTKTALPGKLSTVKVSGGLAMAPVAPVATVL